MNTETLKQKLATVQICSGTSDPASGQGCALDIVEWLSGEPYSGSYNPSCVHRDLLDIVPQWNDGLTDEARNSDVSRRFILTIMGTADLPLNIAPILAEYRDKHTPILAEYNTKHDPILAEYRAKYAPIWAEYNTKRASFLAEYNTKRASFLAEYEAKHALIWAEYEAKHTPSILTAYGQVIAHIELLLLKAQGT